MLREVAMILGGKFLGATGKVWAVTFAIVSITVVSPLVGSNRMKLVVVTIRARPSLPNWTPSGGSPRANVCIALLLFRLMTVSALAGPEGATKFPKCAITR